MGHLRDIDVRIDIDISCHQIANSMRLRVTHIFVVITL